MSLLNHLYYSEVSGRGSESTSHFYLFSPRTEEETFREPVTQEAHGKGSPRWQLWLWVYN